MLSTSDTGAAVSTIKVGDTFELLGNDAHPLTVSEAIPGGFLVDCPQCGWCEVEGVAVPVGSQRRELGDGVSAVQSARAVGEGGGRCES